MRLLAVDAYWRLAVSAVEAGQLSVDGEGNSPAIWLERLLLLDPVHEPAHRLLMQLYHREGRTASALGQYRICEDALKRHLDLSPSEQTLALFEAIRDGQEPQSFEALSQPVNGLRKSIADIWDRRRLLIASALVLILASSLGAAWGLWFAKRETIEVADVSLMRFPLPIKPSIAILPFQNARGTAETETFADSIAEEISSALSIVSEMFVISHATAMTYKGRQVGVRQVAEDLGVRYVVEGSVQNVDEKVRIRVQLADAIEGYVLWADSFDRELVDVFSLQDELTHKIVTELQVEITEGEQDRLTLMRGTGNFQAWLLVGQALRHLRRVTRTDAVKARELYRKATELDPGYSKAWAGLAWTHILDVRFGWSRSPMASLERAAAYSLKAKELDPERPLTHSLLAMLELIAGNHDNAVALAMRAVELNPNGADVTAILAWILSYSGQTEESITRIKAAMRLSPFYADWYRWVLGRSYRLAGRTDDAVMILEVAHRERPNALVPLVELAMSHAAAGDLLQGRREAANVLELQPRFSARAWAAVPSYKDRKLEAEDLRLLRVLGLPD